MNKYFEKVRDFVDDSIIPDLVAYFAKSTIVGFYEAARVSGAILFMLLLGNKKYLLAGFMMTMTGIVTTVEREVTEDWEI